MNHRGQVYTLRTESHQTLVYYSICRSIYAGFKDFCECHTHDPFAEHMWVISGMC